MGTLAYEAALQRDVPQYELQLISGTHIVSAAAPDRRTDILRMPGS